MSAQTITAKLKTQEKAYEEKDWQTVADLGQLLEGHDTKFNSAVSRLIWDALAAKDYNAAFALAEQYSQSGWTPERLTDYLKRDCKMNGRADKLYQEYLKIKENAE